ncbi:Eco57I restriction-modification methylase domain-containing protein [Laribacter hongkongensis]|uniref:site-specific DNA-methyltransferase (adenine-specific) n=1 Tax=Laribacter hongkongensis TaxID=168471 RepID=A0ABD4SQ97_9NEIS|nr:hypothetical protein [Laribacter hongkongensis]MCG9025463.1 hypothetical protein [Laribacter hongkongensis]
MKSKAITSRSGACAALTSSSPRLEQVLLAGIKAFCEELQKEKSTSRFRSFQAWKKYWIASNGEIGRKKEVATEAFEGVLGARSEADPYQFIFIVETAMAFIAKELCCAAVNSGIASNAASRIFEWWESEPSASTLEVSFELKKELMKVDRDELLDLLSNDPLRDIYHTLIPKAIRHTLGAYLSPPDLCKYVINNSLAHEVFTSPEKTLLEPNCGLGAFFSALLAKGLSIIECGDTSKEMLGNAFKDRVCGIEKNLGSYVISRYLHAAICGLLTGGVSDKENILWADSVFVDEGFISEKISAGLPLSERTLLMGLFRVQCATENVSKSNILEKGTVIAHFDGHQWHDVRIPLHAWFADDGYTDDQELQCLSVYEAVRMENFGDFDFIIGNPPWVNWENLDPEYKKLILPSWPPLGLFAMSGRDRAFSKEDLSVLATYSACLRFGKKAAKVGLLLPQALFQSRKNSKGFRRFQLGQSGLFLHVDKVTDFSDYVAFGDAKNRTAAFFCTLSDEPTKYPVRYLRFVPEKGKGESSGTYKNLWATPSDQSDSTSNWALFEESEEINHSKREGKTYRARTGVFTGGANAVYYVRVLGQDRDLVLLENDTERAKIKVKKQHFLAEHDYLYPFAKGRDVKQWKVCRPIEQGILLPHTVETRIKPISPTVLALQAPKTISYLSQHKAMLQTRASLTALDRANVAEGYYAMLRVGEYTFAPYKVAWRYISKDFCCAVIGPSNICGESKATVLQEKLISIAFSNENEAYFVCAFLSSPKVKREIERRIVGTQVSVHVIEDIHIPVFDSANVIHQEMAALCREGHYTDGLTETRSVMLGILVDRLQEAETSSLARPAMTTTSSSADSEDQSIVLTSRGT